MEMNELAEYLSLFKARNRLSNKDMAGYLNVSERQYRRIENGEMLPRGDVLKKALHIVISEIKYRNYKEIMEKIGQFLISEK